MISAQYEPNKGDDLVLDLKKRDQDYTNHNSTIDISFVHIVIKTLCRSKTLLFFNSCSSCFVQTLLALYSLTTKRCEGKQERLFFLASDTNAGFSFFVFFFFETFLSPLRSGTFCLVPRLLARQQRFLCQKHMGTKWVWVLAESLMNHYHILWPAPHYIYSGFECRDAAPLQVQNVKIGGSVFHYGSIKRLLLLYGGI